MARLRAFRTGFWDGRTNPEELSVGMTYDDDVVQTAYDYGANLGQRLGRLWSRRPQPFTRFARLWREQPDGVCAEPTTNEE